MTQPAQVKPRERDTIVQALAAGVVPRVGLQHIQVGRAIEVGALVKDIDRIADGGSSVPVSYTHLDVYKRQVLAAARQHAGDERGKPRLFRGLLDRARAKRPLEHSNGGRMIFAHEERQAIGQGRAQNGFRGGQGAGLAVHAESSSTSGVGM